MRKILLYLLLFIPLIISGQSIELIEHPTAIGESCSDYLNLVDNSGVVRGGVACNTDWLDGNTDGIADDWDFQSGAGTPVIVTGNGFTGNAQRVPHVTGTLTRFRQLLGFVGTIGHTYGIKMKYRTDGAEMWKIYACGVSELFELSLAVNSGDAISYTGEVTLGTAANMIINFYCLTGNASNYLEIDEIIVWRIE